MSASLPLAESLIAISGDVRRKPALQDRAAQVSAVLSPPRKDFGVWQAPQWPGPCTKIRAAIPGGRFARIRLELTFGEIERIPEPHRRADVERKRQRVGFRRADEPARLWRDRRGSRAHRRATFSCRRETAWPDRAALPSGSTPLRTAASNCWSVHAPMPVSRSGVMFGVVMSPNGVSIGRPPANGLPPRHGMQATQSRDGREIMALFDPVELLLVRICACDSPRRQPSQARGRARRRIDDSAAYAWTSGPGFFRY